MFNSLVAQFKTIVGGITFDNSTPTACITKEPKLKVNSKFWNQLNPIEKEFLISHELMHLMLKHHSRFSPSVKNNVACDLAINSLLMHYMGIGASDIPFLTQNGTFPFAMGLPELQSAEFYCAMLPRNMDEDSFDVFGGDLDESLSDLEKRVDRELVGKLASTSGTLGQTIHAHRKAKLKQSLKSIMGDIAGRDVKDIWGFSNVESFIPSRRFGQISNLMLPNERFMENDDGVKKHRAAVFLDFSGSCLELAGHFVAVAKAIPKNLFDIRTYCFDTKVYPVNINNMKYEAGGGTLFHIINDELKKLRHFDLVFVITDGAGNEIPNPISPEKWHWFLCKGGYADYIPDKSRVYALDNYFIEG